MFLTATETISAVSRAALLWVVVAGSASTCAAAVYDLKGDWSDAANPNGVWAYREGLNTLPHVDNWPQLPGSPFQPAWSRLGTNPNWLPTWFKSTTDNPGGLDFLTGDVVVHSTDTFRGPAGVANVAWDSPMNGTVDISGGVWMAGDIGRGNTWQLSLNDVPLTAGHIFSGDPFSRASPFDFSAGSGGSLALSGVAVSVGDEIRLDLIADNPNSGGFFVGVNFTIAPTPVPTAPCLRDSMRACLIGGRFAVEVEMWDFSGNFFQGMIQHYDGVSSETDQSVAFYSFQEGNVEIDVKMVDACTSGFHSFFVFASGGTNAATRVTITDTFTGEVYIINNPAGRIFITTADSRGFLTCDAPSP